MESRGQDACFLSTVYHGVPCLLCDEFDPVCAPGLYTLALKSVLEELQLHYGLHVRQLDGGVFSLDEHRKRRGIAYMQTGSGGWCPRYLDSISVAPCCEEPAPPEAVACILHRALVFCAQTRAEMRLLVQPWDHFDKRVVYEAVYMTGLLTIEDHEWEVSSYGVALKLKHVRDDEELILTITSIKPWARMPTYVAIGMRWRCPDTRTR